MRIALYHHLPPGGALRVVRDFLSHVPDDVHVDVFGLDDVAGSPFPRAGNLIDGNRPQLQPLDAGWSARVLGGRLAPSVLATRLAAAERSVAQAMNTGGYDVAYVHPCWMSNAPGLVSELRMPTVLYLQEARRTTFEPSYRAERPIALRHAPGRVVNRAMDVVLARRDRLGVQGATLLACNSIYSAERILASYGRSAEIVSLGVDDQVFMRRSSRPSDTTPSVIAVGGLEGFKNQRMIVEALGLMHADRRPRLVLVYERCDPVYRDAVLARAAQLGVKVEEHRGIADDHLAELYSIAAATVLAAQLEPLGLTALESIACGTPVVAVREAGYRETVTEGLNGLLVPRSARALAEGVAHVISGQAGLAKPRDLPGTILPHWSTRASVARQLRLLERTAGA